MKKKINIRKRQEENGHMFATDFSFKFSCTGDLVTMIETREE